MNSISAFRLALVAVIVGGGVGWSAPANPRDRGLRVSQPFASNFPDSLLAEGVTSGFVRAVLHIDAEGRLVDHLVLAYTRIELVREFIAGLAEWEFDPPRERGEPIGTRAEIIFNFEARGAVLSLTAINATLAATRWVGEEVTTLECRPRELDRPPVALQTVAPVHPGPALRPTQPTGSAVLDFYIDSTGRPRMAVIVEATHDAFGAAAAEALTRWRFAPPTRAGRPIAVRVRQTFLFTAPGARSGGTG